MTGRVWGDSSSHRASRARFSPVEVAKCFKRRRKVRRVRTRARCRVSLHTMPGSRLDEGDRKRTPCEDRAKARSFGSELVSAPVGGCGTERGAHALRWHPVPRSRRLRVSDGRLRRWRPVDQSQVRSILAPEHELVSEPVNRRAGLRQQTPDEHLAALDPTARAERVPPEDFGSIPHGLRGPSVRQRRRKSLPAFVGSDPASSSRRRTRRHARGIVVRFRGIPERG